MEIFFLILKTAGVILLVILGLILFLAALLLFVPVRYRAEGRLAEETGIGAYIRFSWLLSLITVRIEYADGLETAVRAAGIRLRLKRGDAVRPDLTERGPKRSKAGSGDRRKLLPEAVISVGRKPPPEATASVGRKPPPEAASPDSRKPPPEAAASDRREPPPEAAASGRRRTPAEEAGEGSRRAGSASAALPTAASACCRTSGFFRSGFWTMRNGSGRTRFITGTC